jgi:hypothetical protein
VNLAAPGAAIDGITMTAGDRFLARAQTAPAENGIYIWNGAAVAATRAPDADTFGELEQAVVGVEEGADAGVSYRQTSVNFVLGTDPVAWASFATSAPPASTTQAGLIEIATQAEVNAGVSAVLAVTPATLAGMDARTKFKEALIGDGSATQYDVTHNFGTRAVIVQVQREASPYDVIGCEIEKTTVNAVRLRFVAAPTVDQFRVLLTAGGFAS